MENEKRLILTEQEAIAKAEQELSTSIYIAECTRSPGMRAIHDKRCSWLSVIVGLAKKSINGDVVEVVRCKDCKHWIHMEDGFGDCTNNRFHLDGHADPTMLADDFCSCGERREGE